MFTQDIDPIKCQAIFTDLIAMFNRVCSILDDLLFNVINIVDLVLGDDRNEFLTGI